MNEKQKELQDAPEKKIKPHKEQPRSKTNKLIAVRDYLNKQYEFRYNIFASKPEYRHLRDANSRFVFFDERAYHNIITDIKMDAGIDIADNDFRALTGSDKLSAEFNPIQDYIFSLPKWDGKPRFFEFLQQVQLIDEDYREHLIMTFRKWFIMMVASLIDDYIINDTILVLSGKQGRGKTRFLESLVPSELSFNYLYVGTFDPHDKDHLEMIGTKMLIVLDEMETLTRTEQGTLKSTISKRNAELRRAYAHAKTNLIRRSSFAGSINYDEFLTDTTGNRRWLPFAIHNIDVNTDYNIGLLYAEALHEFKNGFRTYFDRAEIIELEKVNERFRRPSPEEELVIVNYSIPSKDEVESGNVKYMTSSDIMHDLATMDQYRKMNTNDTVSVRIGRVMSRLGFRQVNRRIGGRDYSIKVWEVRKLDTDESNKIRKGLDERNELLF